ncbi:MAG: LacI family DNA-binding transcriptional regulator [Kiritimatiellae bacterium]|nr:LacI family DNA-binding transcriptional regulator [Kiritimatiellia bacterium]
MQKITREDVARAAGVSKTTVTYVLRDTPGTHISETTKAKVRRVAKRLGYQPNFAATSLVRGKTAIVGLLLPSQDMQFGFYYSRMIAGLVAAAKDTPYHFLYLGMDQPEKYRLCLARGLADGVVILQSDVNETHAAAVHEFALPLVTMNYLNDVGAPQVSMDYEGAVETAYDRMLAHGRKRIALVCRRDNCQPNVRHIDRHNALAERLGNRADFSHVLPESYASEDELLRTLLTDKARDGYVVDGMLHATRLARRLEEAGRSIGGDVDVIGFRVGEREAYARPGIVVLEAQPEEVGRLAWEQMETLLEGRDVAERTRLVPFVEREE